MAGQVFGEDTQQTLQVDLSSYRHERSAAYLIKRALWSCVQLPFWPKMPRRLSPLRIFLLRAFGAKIGKQNLIGSGARIWEPWNLEMEDFSAIGDDARIYNIGKVTIGSNAVISQYAYLCTATHDYTNPAFPLFSLPIRVEASAWIAAGAFVSPGVTIAEGAVIGAYSVVTKSMPAWTVCAGNPCRPIKPRRMTDGRITDGRSI